MCSDTQPQGFLIQITSLDELAAFLALVRGSESHTNNLRAFIQATSDLAAAVSAAAESANAAAHRSPVVRSPAEGETMASVPALDNLAAAITNATTVEASATSLINGFASRQQAAIDAAIANGATAEQLAPVQAEVDALTQSATALSAAVVANTPAAAPPTP